MTVVVEFTADGNLRLTAEVARRYFPTDSLVAVPRGSELWLFPLTGPEGGGLLLKQRNARGDRSALVREALEAGAPLGMAPVGERPATWDEGGGALRVALSAAARAHGR